MKMYFIKPWLCDDPIDVSLNPNGTLAPYEMDSAAAQRRASASSVSPARICSY